MEVQQYRLSNPSIATYSTCWYATWNFNAHWTLLP